MDLHRIIGAEMLTGLRLRLRFEDGFEGIAALSEITRRGGVFAAIIDNPNGFTVMSNGRAIAWKGSDGDDVDFCADALRMIAEQAATRAAE
ncbi:MAG TPA: DUF2442 domain-containing protein [Acetobacteraceae bacterium]